jgi:ZIP family zinc transporter
LVVAKLLGQHHHHHTDDVTNPDHHHHKTTRESLDEKLNEDDLPQPTCCGGPDPVARLEKFQKMASVLQHEAEGDVDDSDDDDDNERISTDDQSDDNNESKEKSSVNSTERDVDEKAVDDNAERVQQENVDERTESGSDAAEQKMEQEKHKLQKMGLNTALAIGLHNFPEGLATFVAAVHDPAVGVVLAVAIALHNIPEGEFVSCIHNTEIYRF